MQSHCVERWEGMREGGVFLSPQECRARALAFEDKIFETRKFVESKNQVLGERISELKSGIEAEGVARTKAISSSWSSEAEARARGLDEVMLYLTLA